MAPAPTIAIRMASPSLNVVNRRGGEHTISPMLHVLNGDCAAEAFAEVRPAAEPRLVWRDILMEGPLGDELRGDGLAHARAAYLERHFGIDEGQYAEEVRQAEAGLDDGARHEEVVLWFEEDLFCYVNLLYRDSRAGPVWRWDDEGRRLD